MSTRPWRRPELMITVAAIAATGCGGKARPGVTAPASTTVPAAPTRAAEHPIAARLAAYEAATCACTVLSCASTVDREMDAWVEANLDEVHRYVVDPAHVADVEAGGKRVGACQQRLHDAATSQERAAVDAEVLRHIAALSALADDMCACTHGRCAEEVIKRMTALEDPAGPPTHDQMTTSSAIRARLAGCLQRGLAGTGPPAPRVFFRTPRPGHVIVSVVMDVERAGTGWRVTVTGGTRNGFDASWTRFHVLAPPPYVGVTGELEYTPTTTTVELPGVVDHVDIMSGLLTVEVGP